MQDSKTELNLNSALLPETDSQNWTEPAEKTKSLRNTNGRRRAIDERRTQWQNHTNEIRGSKTKHTALNTRHYQNKTGTGSIET